MTFPDKRLAIKLEASLAHDMREYVEVFQRTFPDKKVAYRVIADGVAICLGKQYLNLAVGLGMDTHVTAAHLDQLESLFHEYDIPPYIEITPFTDAEFLHLMAMQNYHVRAFTTAYFHPLDTIPATPSDIVVLPIDDTQRNIWIETVMDITADDTATSTHLATSVTYRPHTTCFLAYLDDVPVGASALSIRDNIATFYFTATRQAYRNRGVQAAMIAARLQYAKDHDCEMAFATTIPGNNSMRNIIRAGFHVAYSRCMMQKEA